MAQISRRVIRSETLLKDQHPVLQRIFGARGIISADELNYNLDQLLSYQDLCGIDEASALLAKAIMQNQRVLIVGDFDADGATSTAVAIRALKSFGLSKVSYLVPNRFDFGYGLTPELVAVAAKSQPDLIITVDNGIASEAGVQAAKALGIQVIVTDHHLPGETLPKAEAIVNPNQAGDKFPSKNLAGVGVIFYVMLALRRYLSQRKWFESQNMPQPNMAKLLDLVALGTIADVVLLDKNNRVLVQQGLRRIRAGHCVPGIAALLTIAKRKLEKVTAADLGFAAGPRLNAAGRLDDMSLGIECLLTDDAQLAQHIAEQLDQLNQDRRQIEADMQQQALTMLDKFSLASTTSDIPKGLCIFDKSWHQGVIGILASRIKDKYHRPVIAFAEGGDGQLKGSARSIKGLHIRDVIAAIAVDYPQLVTKFGGHAMAAGLTINALNFEVFQSKFYDELSRRLTEKDLKHLIETDGDLAKDELTLKTAEILREAGPWGQGFPEPLFDGEFNLLEQRLVGEKHLKMVLELPDSNAILDGILFHADLSQWPNHRCHRVRLVYRLDVNEYYEAKQVQLMVQHIEVLSL